MRILTILVFTAAGLLFSVVTCAPLPYSQTSTMEAEVIPDFYSQEKQDHLQHLKENGYPIKAPEIEVGDSFRVLLDELDRMSNDPMCWGYIDITYASVSRLYTTTAIELSNLTPYESPYGWSEAGPTTTTLVVTFDQNERIVSYSIY